MFDPFQTILKSASSIQHSWKRFTFCNNHEPWAYIDAECRMQIHGFIQAKRWLGFCVLLRYCCAITILNYSLFAISLCNDFKIECKHKTSIAFSVEHGARRLTVEFVNLEKEHLMETYYYNNNRTNPFRNLFKLRKWPFEHWTMSLILMNLKYRHSNVQWMKENAGEEIQELHCRLQTANTYLYAVYSN